MTQKRIPQLLAWMKINIESRLQNLQIKILILEVLLAKLLSLSLSYLQIAYNRLPILSHKLGEIPTSKSFELNPQAVYKFEQGDKVTYKSAEGQVVSIIR